MQTVRISPKLEFASPRMHQLEKAGETILEGKLTTTNTTTNADNIFDLINILFY
jgi:hypothetical protein